MLKLKKNQRDHSANSYDIYSLATTTPCLKIPLLHVDVYPEIDILRLYYIWTEH